MKLSARESNEDTQEERLSETIKHETKSTQNRTEKRAEFDWYACGVSKQRSESGKIYFRATSFQVALNGMVDFFEEHGQVHSIDLVHRPTGQITRFYNPGPPF